MIKHPVGTNKDGTVKYRFELTEDERDQGFLVGFATGPINGTFRLDDGSEYDVTPAAIPVRMEHKHELHYKIIKAHNTRPESPFYELELPGDGSLAAMIADEEARHKASLELASHNDDVGDGAPAAQAESTEAPGAPPQS